MYLMLNLNVYFFVYFGNTKNVLKVMNHTVVYLCLDAIMMKAEAWLIVDFSPPIRTMLVLRMYLDEQPSLIVCIFVKAHAIFLK